MSSNSSITTDEFVAGQKLLVHLAENGHSFEFKCDGSMQVAQIQRMIESISGVQCVDQLLICGKISLDPQQPLAYYKLPQDDREVFVFNKSRLLSDSPPPPPEVIDVTNTATVPSPSSRSDGSHALDRATDPALKALASYEEQFWYHYHCANAFHERTKGKFELCERLLREIQVQERALETARGNLDHYFKRLNQRFSEFMRCFWQQNRVHAELLGNFERDVERLRSLRLHPSIQSEGRKCLLDLVKVDELREWRGICSSSHRQFETKVAQLKKKFGELARSVESVCSGMYAADSKDLEVSIRDRKSVV